MSSGVAPARGAAACILLASLALLGCNTNADVLVEVAEDGSGTVTVDVELDADAAAAIGGPDSLVLSDLEDTGWELGSAEVAEDSALRISAAHDFSDGAELASVLDAVAGPGVFTDVSIDVEESFGSSEWSAGMDVSVSGDPAQFSDDALTGVLGGLPLGRTPEELAEVGATEPGAATMTVELSLFGEDTDSARLDLTSGEASSAVLSVRHTETQVFVFLLAGLGAALLLASLVFAVLALRNRS